LEKVTAKTGLFFNRQTAFSIPSPAMVSFKFGRPWRFLETQFSPSARVGMAKISTPQGASGLASEGRESVKLSMEFRDRPKRGNIPDFSTQAVRYFEPFPRFGFGRLWQV
jgi:hypothetical protein